MTDTAATPPIKKRARIISRITTWILRLLLLFTALFFIMLMVAALLGGNGPAQKESLENTWDIFLIAKK